MRLKVGDRYKISEKLKKAFGVVANDAKIISISAGIVSLQIGGITFPLKENIAVNNLSSIQTLTAQFKEEVEDVVVPVVEVVVEDVVHPVEEEESEVPTDNEEMEIDEENNVQQEDGNDEDKMEDITVEKPVNTEPDTIPPVVSITPKKVEEEAEVIEPEVQDIVEPEIISVTPDVEEEYFDEEEYNPDDDWGM